MNRPEDDFKNRSLKRKLLTAEEERALAGRVRAGDSEAVNIFVMANMRLVVKKAGKFHRSMPWVPESDLIQDGSLGLIDAVKGYNPEKGYRFSTYAAEIIRQRMVSGVRERAGAIYIPEEVQKARAKLKSGLYQFLGEFGHFPTHFELCEYLGIGHNLAMTLEKLPRSVSIEAMRQSRRNSFVLDQIPDHSSPDPLKTTIEVLEREQLHQLLKRLSKKKREMILKRFAVLGGEPETLESLGKREGKTKEWARLKQVAIIEELRGHAIALQGACLF